MIRNVVIHVSNEQPLLADLYGVPTAGDAGLLCTNLRMMDGKRPVFIDRITSTFFFPYLHIRFLEIEPGELRRHVAEAGDGPVSLAEAVDSPRSSPVGDPGSTMPVLAAAPAAGDDGTPELDLDLGDIDEGFLQRIRDI